jgi:hypothetical protein
LKKYLVLSIFFVLFLLLFYHIKQNVVFKRCLLIPKRLNPIILRGVLLCTILLLQRIPELILYSGIFLISKLDFLTKKSIFLTSKLDFLIKKLIFLTSKLDFLIKKSIFLTSKLYFLTKKMIFLTKKLVFLISK